MQKKLIAVAVAGLVSGAAFAQSNVTIYGVGDATFDVVSATGATATNANLPSRNRTTFNSSYIGFKGAESLGNGLTAVFQFETGIGENPTGSFNSTTGQTYGWAGRDTMVAIAGGFGTLAFGNVTGPTRLLGSVMDPNAGSTGIGANTALLGKLGGGSGAGVFDQRIANAVAYISPTFSGFYGVIGYLPNEGRGTDATASAAVAATSSVCMSAAGVVTNPAGPCGAGLTTLRSNAVAAVAPQLNTSAWTLGGVYGNGPILAAITWTKAKDANASSSGSSFTYGNNAITSFAGGAAPLIDATDTRIGFKYDFGMATVGIMWDQMKATLASDLGSGKQAVWYVPVTVKLGNGKLIGQYGKAGKVSWGGTVGTLTSAINGYDDSAKHFMIGYEYNLSKRTLVKAVWSQISNGQNGSYDFLYGVSAPNTTAYGAGVAVGADPRGLSVGLRHSF
jgi:predicted porin